MQVSIEKKEGVQNVITVTVPAEDVKKAYEKAFRKCAKNAKLDGFRKGHIPTAKLEQYFGSQIYSEACDGIVNETFPKAVIESKLMPVGAPSIALKKAEFKSEPEFVYEITVEVEPEFEIKAFEELKVKTVKSELTDADIDQMIENLRKQQGKWAVKDDLAVEDGTQAKIDFLGRCDGVEFEGGKAENFTLNVPETQMIPGFTEQIKGHKAGEKFTIQVKFPEEYHAENLKGKDAEFDITVNSVSKLELPEVNADFVKIYGVADGSIDTFKADLRKNMERELKRAVYAQNRDRLFDALTTQYADLPVPAAYVEEQVDRLAANFENQMRMYGMKKLPASFKKDEMFKDEATKQARLGVVVRKIVADMKLEEPSEEFLNDQLNMIASAYDKPEEVIAEIKKDKKEFANIKNAALEAEVVAKVLAKAADGEETKTFSELVGRR